MSFKKSILLAALSIAALASSQAASINGEIGIVLDGSVATANVDFVNDSVTFTTTAADGHNAVVNSTSGDYAGAFGAGVTYSNFEYDSSVGWDPIWTLTLSPSTYFVLTKINSVLELPGIPFISLQGEGIAYMAGFEATHGVWSFSADAAGGGRFNYSSKTKVPDSGSSAILLGLGLLGLGFVARKRK